MSPGRNDRRALMIVVAGAMMASGGLTVLILAGLLRLNELGLGGWLGWFNLAVLSGGWWLAWTWTRPGIVLPAANWAPLSHFSDNDKLLWKLASKSIVSRSARLAATGVPANWFKIISEMWEELLVPSCPAQPLQWRDKTLSELAAAVHAGQLRLRKRVESLLGHLLLPRIERWELAWRSGVLLDRYGILAWVPGLILAPVDSLARYLAGWVIRSPAAQGIRRESARILWELLLRDLTVVLIDFQAGRLRMSGSRYSDLVETVDHGLSGVSLIRPALLAFTQGLPLAILVSAGLYSLGMSHRFLAIASMLAIMCGLFLLGMGSREWLFPPLPASKDDVECGRKAVEIIISGMARGPAPRIFDTASWIAVAESMDLEVSKAVSSSGSGWRGRSMGEWLRGIEALSRGLDNLVRQALPGSRHIRLGDWIEAGGWLGWLGRVTSGGAALLPAVPSRGGLAAMAFSWLAGETKRHTDDFLREIIFRAVVRHTGKFLIDIHAGRWRNPSGPVDVEVKGESRPVLLVVGSAGAGCTTVANGLRESSQLSGWEIRESSSLWSPETGSTGITQVVELARQADAMVLVVRAVGAAREPEVRLLQMWRKGCREGETGTPILGLLSAVDLVAPSLEWNPPYDLSHGTARKEQSIRASLDAVRTRFGDGVDEWKAAGFRNGLWWGLNEEVIPWLEESLERARGVKLARAMASDAEGGDWMEPVRQASIGLRSLSAFWGSGWKKAEPPA